MVKWIVKKLAMNADNPEVPELEDGYVPFAITEERDKDGRWFILWFRKRV